MLLSAAGVLDWISRIQFLQSLLQSEFVRTYLLPVVYAMLTAWAGISDDMSLMWVLMTSALAFAGVTTGILRTSEYRDRKNPLNKLKFIQTAVNCDLSPLQLLNRQQRRSKQPIQRTIEKIQIGVYLRNDAMFPMSVLLEKATTIMEENEPPRTTYPKEASIIYPGNAVMITDEVIDMKQMDCKNISGHMDMVIKYGLPGKETLHQHFKAKVSVMMQSAGFITAIYTNWEK